MNLVNSNKKHILKPMYVLLFVILFLTHAISLKATNNNIDSNYLNDEYTIDTSNLYFINRKGPTLIISKKGDSLALYNDVDTSYVIGSSSPVKIESKHKIIFYPADNSSGIAWKVNPQIITNATSLTNGLENTQKIVSTIGPGNYAAYLCDTLRSFGHDDWYLPSIEELNTFFENKSLVGAKTTFYWSSTEVENNYAWSQYCIYGVIFKHSKASLLRVRCVRKEN